MILVVVDFQDKYCLALSFIFGLVIPSLIAALYWNDFWGGLIYGGFMARVITWHCTFSINSLTHYIGAATYTNELTAKDNFWIALITSGGGYHNFVSFVKIIIFVVVKFYSD
jgi:stearoyl-CoA desaturase (Delta-9 desaturase)